MTEPVQTGSSLPAPPEPDPRRWWALTVLAAAQLMIVLDASIVNIALPSAQTDLGISNADRQWVVTAYTLAFGGLLLLGGRIADYMGRKRTFVIGLLGFAGASALGGLAANQELLFAARGLQGAFAALMAPASLSLVTVTFTEPKERARAFGVFGALVRRRRGDRPDRRWRAHRVHLLALVPRRQRAGRPDRRGSRAGPRAREQGARRHPVRRAGRAAGDRSACSRWSTGSPRRPRPRTPRNPSDTSVQGWARPRTLTFLVVAVVLLVAFVCLGDAGRNPMLPMRVVLHRNRGGSYLVFLLVGAGLFAMFLFLTYYFQLNLGYSPLKAGLRVPAVQRRHHPHRRRGRAAAAAARTEGADGPRPGHGGDRHAAADPDRAGHVVLDPRAAGRAADERRSGRRVRPRVEHGPDRRGPHDAGVASALLNTAQQIGGSLGTALLNTLFAGAVTGYFVDHPPPDAGEAKDAAAVRVHPRLPRVVLLGRRAARRGPGGDGGLHQRRQGGPARPSWQRPTSRPDRATAQRSRRLPRPGGRPPAGRPRRRR